MAEYRDSWEALRAAGAEVVALAVDDAARSEPLRREMRLPFPILCDTRREVVRAWGLFNPAEHGGIAYPAVFVIDQERVVRWRSLDRTAARVSTGAVLRFLLEGRPPPAPRRVIPRLGDFVRALRNWIGRGGTTPVG